MQCHKHTHTHKSPTKQKTKITKTVLSYRQIVCIIFRYISHSFRFQTNENLCNFSGVSFCHARCRCRLLFNRNQFKIHHQKSLLRSEKTVSPSFSLRRIQFQMFNSVSKRKFVFFCCNFLYFSLKFSSSINSIGHRMSVTNGRQERMSHVIFRYVPTIHIKSELLRQE